MIEYFYSIRDRIGMTKHHSKKYKKGGVEKQLALGLPVQKNATMTVPFTDASTSVIQQPAAGLKMPQGMNEAFITMYTLIAALCAALFGMLFIIGWTDIFEYIYNESSQTFGMIKDPNLFIKDTTDYDAMLYITTNTTADEPYHVFLEESVISYIYKFIGMFIILFAVQYGLFFTFMLYSKIRQLPFNDTVKPPMIVIISIMMSLVGATILSSIYKLYFINKTQSSLKDMRKQMRDTKLFLYKNMTHNVDFLNALLTNDLVALLSILTNEINKNNRNTASCSSPTANCDIEVEKMVFTISLYSYLNHQVPESDVNYDTIRSIFTVNNIQHAKIDPTNYFYYKQPLYIPNMFSTLQNSNGIPLFTNAERELIFLNKLTTLFQTANKKLARLQTIMKGKHTLLKYIILFAIATSVIICVFIVLYYNDIKTLLSSLYSKIPSLTKKT